MLKKIALSGILLCLFIAIPLALLGIRRVEIGTPFVTFMRTVSQDLQQYKIAIPTIPNIPSVDEFKGAWLILDVVIKFFNFIINICNFAITFMNVIIQFIQMLFIIIKRLITLKDTLEASAVRTSAQALIL